MTSDVANSLDDWSTTEGSNSPAGSTAISTNMDDNLRMIQAVVRTLAAQDTIASDTTTDLSTVAGTFVTVTGATTITGLGTLSAGMFKFLKFADALTLTHNGASLILPTAANITTAAGDTCLMESLGSGNWKCWSYQRASGADLKPAASQAEMEAGTEAALRSMSPLRVAQAIVALATTPPQIQTLAASVGSNALTISAPALTLDFRSTTLGSGTITRVSGDPADLVISSGSTLGTVSGIQSRIAVLVLNNAGTLELAAINISGGNDLSETGLISTTAEGGAGGADAANVAYSATARTNVAYRVHGYIESTQAAAGTWATPPSRVQGMGGLATVGKNGRTWQDLTGSRSAWTTYYNPTGDDIEVNLCVNTTGNPSTSVLAVNDVAVGKFYTNSTGTWIGEISGKVPPGGHYVVNTSNASLVNWSEFR